jgi:hypothetical protein
MVIMNNRSGEYIHTGPFSQLDAQTGHCQESLALTLVLSINGQDTTIPGANIKVCELAILRYGFTGVLEFYVPNDQREDTLIDTFATEDLISLALGINAVHNLPEPLPKAFTVKGLVTQKSVTESAYRQVNGAPVLYRYYRIHFADPAQVLWQQHYPSELYVDDCMTTVINAQVVSPITLTIDFSPADTIVPLICLALGNTDNSHPGETGVTNKASFYDFLMGYIHDNNGFFIYDYEEQTYQICLEEPQLQNTTAFLPHEINTIQHTWPASKRSVTSLLNATADNSKNTPLTNEQAVAGIKHDTMLRQSIEDRFNQRKDMQSNRLTVHGKQIQVVFNQWPLQTFWPECELSVDPSVDGQHFLHANQIYRCASLYINVEALDNRPEKDLDLTYTQYQLLYQAQGHPTDKPQSVLPKYTLPQYPLYVEGLIVSDQGQDNEKTFDVPKNDDTGQFEYKVNIPLWDLTIKVMLEPDYLNSHFYFPFYRDTKLLLAFDLYRAHVVKVLNWGEGVQLPMATQGNHILFGKTSEDQTSVSHFYDDGKPVLAIKRNKENDTELVRLEEGSIILQTCEDD